MDPGTCDFVPQPCEANRIADCILEGDCSLSDFEIPSTEVYFTSLQDIEPPGLGAIQLQINALDACFLASLTLAFQKAGCPMPAIPQPPDPDAILETITTCIERVQEGVAESASNIGAWAQAMTITFNDDGSPTRIQVP